MTSRKLPDKRFFVVDAGDAAYYLVTADRRAGSVSPFEKEKSMTKSEINSTDDDAAAAPPATQARKYLLARVAGHIAGSVVAAPSKKSTTPAAIAEISVDVAEAILQRVGL